MKNLFTHEENNKITNLNEKFAEQNSCPYHKIPAHINSVISKASSDKVSNMKKEITAILEKNLSLEEIPKQLMVHGVLNGLSYKSVIKTIKHTYDIILLQSGVSDIIVETLDDMIEKIPNAEYIDMIDLTNKEHRKAWGAVFSSIFQKAIHKSILSWERKKLETDNSYARALPYAYRHAAMNKGEEFSFGEIILQGVGDGLFNSLDVLTSIPELYQKKYNKLPDKDVYRQIFIQSKKDIIIPLASIHLDFLTGVIRKEDDKLCSPLDLTSDNFELDDKNHIIAKKLYLQNIIKKINHEIAETDFLSYMVPGHPAAQIAVRTGCPALSAQTKDEKRVIETFFDKLVEVLDKVYFPKWEE